ncbi:MAG: hypothetical protein ACLSC9_00565 [Barnesiella sp.]
MKLSSLYKKLFTENGFFLPLNPYLETAQLDYEDEKIISRIHDRIATLIITATIFDETEKASPGDYPHEFDFLRMLKGLHTDAFTTLCSIYVGAGILFQHATGTSEQKAVDYWKSKFPLSEEEIKTLQKLSGQEIFTLCNFLLQPQYTLRISGNAGHPVLFQFTDIELENMLNYNGTVLAANNGYIRSKYYLHLSIVHVLDYLNILNKYLCESNEQEELQRECILEEGVIQKFHSIKEEYTGT